MINVLSRKRRIFNLWERNGTTGRGSSLANPPASRSGRFFAAPTPYPAGPCPKIGASRDPYPIAPLLHRYCTEIILRAARIFGGSAGEIRVTAPFFGGRGVRWRRLGTMGAGNASV